MDVDHRDPEDEGRVAVPRSLSLRQWAALLFAFYFGGIGSLLVLVEKGLTENWQSDQPQNQGDVAGCAVVWKSTLGGTGSDAANMIIPSSDGGFLLVGHTTSFGEGQGLLVIRITEQGGKIWQKAYPHQGIWTSGSVAEAQDGGYLIATTSQGSSDPWTFDNDIELFRISDKGKLTWNRTYGATGNGLNDWAAACVGTEDGGFIVVGTTTSAENGLPDMYVLKITDDGDEVWERSYGGVGQDSGQTITASGDGGFVIAGRTTSHGPDNGTYLVKIDARGEVVWEKSYPLIGDTARAIMNAGDGYIVVGKTTTDGWEETDAFALKVDAKGNREWRKSYGGGNWDEARSIHRSIHGGYLIFGGTDRSWTPNEQSVGIYIFKIDDAGNLVWEYRYGGSHTPATASPQAKDGTFVLAGSTGGDIIVMKIKETIPSDSPRQ